ncbi:MAG: VPLPA-CTERM sorting domain-containing protein [Roseobacter sp.]
MGNKILAATMIAGLAITSDATSAATITVGTIAGTIATVDTTSGDIKTSFNPGVGGWFDIAINNAGTAIGIVRGSGVYSIDLGAQSATSLGSSGAFINSLAFGNGESLFGTGNNGFYSVNTTTGAASLVGSGVGAGFRSSGDIAYGGGTTFYGTSSGNCGGIGGDCLWSIDSTTGAGSIIGSIGVNDVYGLGIVDGLLFGLSASNAAYSIDTTTGAGTFLTSYSVAGVTGGAAVPPSAVTPIPVPASLPLLTVGLGGLVIVARRRRRVP